MHAKPALDVDELEQLLNQSFPIHYTNLKFGGLFYRELLQVSEGFLPFLARLIARGAYRRAKKDKKHPEDAARLYEKNPKFKVTSM